MNLTTPIPVATADRSSSPDRRTRRVIAIGISTFAAAATWIVADLAPGLDLTAPTFDSAKPPTAVSVGEVVAAAALAMLLGWALLAILERKTTRPKALWMSAAIAATIVSLAGPMTGTGVDITQRTGLVVLHLIVSASYVPLMQRTIPTSHETQS